MIKHDPYNLTQVTVTVDAEDFQMPYETPSLIEYETFQWRYFRLTNLPGHFQHVRLGNQIFGEVAKK